MSQRAEDGTIILIGFNYGYQDMLMNFICRLQQLGVNNYVIAAFDDQAFSYCRREVGLGPEGPARFSSLDHPSLIHS